jgi:hypothetical protein
MPFYGTSKALNKSLDQSTGLLEVEVVQGGGGLSSGTPNQTSVAGSVSNSVLIASNAVRKGATITNESTANLYLKLGTTASITSYSVKMATNSFFEVPFGYTGEIDGIWDAANGFARITELT